MRDADLKKLRAICLALPEASETHTWDHFQWRIRDKIFCGTGGYENEAVYVKVGLEAQGSFLLDARFFKTPHIGQHGWISTLVNPQSNWQELKSLIEASYAMIAKPPKTRAKPAAKKPASRRAGQ